MNVLLSVINANVYGSQKHKHNCWELVYRLTGDSITVIDKIAYRISEKDFYLIPPNTFHEDTAQKPFTDLVIRFNDVPISGTLILHDYDGLIHSYLQIINYVTTKKDNNYTVVADSSADAFFQYLKTYSSVPSDFVHKLKNSIYENVSNPYFNLTNEIENMNYNPDYIRRCFRSETGKTPLNYLTDLRVDRAKQLLIMYTNESIEIISAKCGFQNSFYFSTCFKKHTGHSPLQYRKINLKNGKPV